MEESTADVGVYSNIFSASSLEEMLKLWKVSPKIDQLKPSNNPEYLAFRTKKGFPVALTSIKKFIDSTPRVESLYPFFQSNDKFWIVPCDYEDQIYGWVLRGYEQKDYRVITDGDGFQMAFGFQAFDDFKGGDPIVLTEGTKDCLYMQTMYKYTLGLLSLSLSEELITILSLLTRKLILAFDNDKKGQDRVKQLKEKLSARGIQVVALVPALKDWGEYYVDCRYAEQSKKQLELLLSKLA